MTHRVTLLIKGMTCHGCVDALTRILTASPAISHTAIDLSSGHASLCYDPERATINDLCRLIEDAGFEAIYPQK